MSAEPILSIQDLEQRFKTPGGLVYAVPQALGEIDLNLDHERTRDGVLVAASVEQVRERIEAAEKSVPVEFTGWLPVFLNFGNCGTHPQFAHTQEPPPGYRFVRSKPAEGVAGSESGFAPSSEAFESSGVVVPPLGSQAASTSAKHARRSMGRSSGARAIRSSRRPNVGFSRHGSAVSAANDTRTDVRRRREVR